MPRHRGNLRRWRIQLEHYHDVALGRTQTTKFHFNFTTANFIKMKKILCILAAGALLCGCETPSQQPVKSADQVLDEIDKEMGRPTKTEREAYIAGHPDLPKEDVDFVRSGGMTFKEADSEIQRVRDQVESDRKWKAENAKWEQSRKNYLSQTNLSDSIRTAIEQHQFVIGMTTDEARLSHREPDKINRFGDANGTSEQWIYGDTYLYFTGGILTSYQKW